MITTALNLHLANKNLILVTGGVGQATGRHHAGEHVARKGWQEEMVASWSLVCIEEDRW